MEWFRNQNNSENRIIAYKQLFVASMYFLKLLNLSKVNLAEKLTEKRNSDSPSLVMFSVVKNGEQIGKSGDGPLASHVTWLRFCKFLNFSVFDSLLLIWR